MPIPAFFEVDFSTYRKDLIEQALNRMLEQHYDKCVLRQLVSAIMQEVQALYDAILDMQSKRTLYEAEKENLDALGRIVGEPRAPYQYDESCWMFADRQAQPPDFSSCWCINAPFAAFVPAEDAEYRLNILTRIVKNHTLTASIPEITYLAKLVTGIDVSYDKTGPMQCTLVVPSTISTTAYNLLIGSTSNRRADDIFAMPYPATLWFDGTITYVPDKFFCSDRDETTGQQCDTAPCAVSTTISRG